MILEVLTKFDKCSYNNYYVTDGFYVKWISFELVFPFTFSTSSNTVLDLSCEMYDDAYEVKTHSPNCSNKYPQ